MKDAKTLLEFKRESDPRSRCAVCELPKDIVAQIDEAQRSRAVGVPTIAKWLTSIGRELSESAVRRHGAHAQG